MVAQPVAADTLPGVLDLVVYGASGFGQQVMFWVEDSTAAGERWNPLGFVDDDEAAHGDERTGHAVLGGRDWVLERAASGPLAVVLGIAVPEIKQRIVAGLEQSETVEFPSVVHPSAVLSKHCAVERGSVVGPQNVLSVNVAAGPFATVNTACTLGHDARVGEFATLLPGCNVSGHVRIERGASMGTNSAVSQHVVVGEGAVVGAGATVVDDLPAGCTAVGTPARPI